MLSDDDTPHADNDALTDDSRLLPPLLRCPCLLGVEAKLPLHGAEVLLLSCDGDRASVVLAAELLRFAFGSTSAGRLKWSPELLSVLWLRARRNASNDDDVAMLFIGTTLCNMTRP